MLAKVSQKDLLKAFREVARLKPAGEWRHACSLEVVDDKLFVARAEKGTYAEAGISTSEREAGRAFMPSAARLAGLISGMRGEILLQTKPYKKLILNNGRTTVELAVDEAVEKLSPLAKRPDPVAGTRVSMSNFSAKMAQVYHAMAREQSRPALSGVSFWPNGDAVCADGFRLAIIGGPSQVPYQVTVPGNVVNVVRKYSDVSFNFTEQVSSRIQVSAGNISVYASYMTNFPQYPQLVPNKAEFAVTVNRAELIEALRLIAALKTHGDITRIWTTDDNELMIQSGQGDFENISTRIPARGEVKIAFNGRYMLEALRAIKDEEVTILTIKDAGDRKQPMVIRDTSGLVQVMMPMYVQW